MGKSVYSLVLSDEVVEAVDRLAYSMSTSRSNLINQILAERVEYITPERRISDIFSSIQSLMRDECFQVRQQPSDAMLSIRSALSYRYKPVIRYGLELYRNDGATIGCLRVSFRTQSEQLKSDLTGFLRLWAALEHRYIIALFPEGITYTIEDGRFTRTFRLPAEREKQSTEEIGRAIASYINNFDDVLKEYFAALGDVDKAIARATAVYERKLAEGMTVI